MKKSVGRYKRFRKIPLGLVKSGARGLEECWPVLSQGVCSEKTQCNLGETAVVNSTSHRVIFH